MLALVLQPDGRFKCRTGRDGGREASIDLFNFQAKIARYIVRHDSIKFILPMLQTSGLQPLKLTTPVHSGVFFLCFNLSNTPFKGND